MILRTRGNDRHLRAADLTAIDQIARDRGGYAGGQVRVDNQTMAGLPAFDAAIHRAAEAVAGLTMRVWRGRSIDRREVTGSWQARLFAQAAPNPEQSWWDFWVTAEASLTARRNAFIWRTITDGRVTALWALHPDQVAVDIRDGKVAYRVRIGGGLLDPTGTTTLGMREAAVTTRELMHVKGPGGGGLPVAPSPIDVFRQAIGGQLAQTAYTERFYTQSTGDSTILSFPLEITNAQAKEAKALWDAGGGVGGAYGTRVVSGGASVTTIGLSQRDAQWVEGMSLGVEDAARIMNWEPSLIGGGASGQDDAPRTPEHELTRMVRYRLAPRLKRWDAALRSDPYLFGPGARDYPAFDWEGLIEADIATQTDADVKNVQAGISLVDEIRAGRGLPPLPGGMGQVPQIVPVGGSPHGVPLPSPPTAADTAPPDTQE